MCSRPIYNLLLARVVAPSVLVAEARLAFVAALAAHAETAFGALFTETPVAVFVCIAVGRFLAGVTTGLIGGRESAVMLICEEGILVVMALAVRIVVDYHFAGIVWLDSRA
jgi:hypothetical protein